MNLIDGDLLDAALPKEKSYVRTDTAVVERFDDEEFRQRFRLTKGSFLTLLAQLEGVYVKPDSNRGLPVALDMKLASFLSTLATNCFQLSTADHMGISQASISRHFHEILDLLFSMRDKYIFWPDDCEYAEISRRFYTKCGIPGIVGCIDSCFLSVFNRFSEIYTCHYDKPRQEPPPRIIFPNILV